MPATPKLQLPVIHWPHQHDQLPAIVGPPLTFVWIQVQPISTRSQLGTLFIKHFKRLLWGIFFSSFDCCATPFINQCIDSGVCFRDLINARPWIHCLIITQPLLVYYDYVICIFASTCRKQACIPAGLPLWSSWGPGSVRHEPRIHNLFGSGVCRLQSPSSKWHLCDWVPLQLETRIILWCWLRKPLNQWTYFTVFSFSLLAASFFSGFCFLLRKSKSINIMTLDKFASTTSSFYAVFGLHKL